MISQKPTLLQRTTEFWGDLLKPQSLFTKYCPTKEEDGYKKPSCSHAAARMGGWMADLNILG